jgi:fucose permease
MPEGKISDGKRASLLLALSYVGFVSLGLPDTVLGAAWPAVRDELGLAVDAAGPICLVTMGGVVLSSIASGRLRRRLGNGTVLIASTVLAAAALFTNARAPRYAFMLLAGALAGLGGGAIDACLNDFMARRYSARHMNWLHACWGVGASLAPAIVSAVLARGGSWRSAYAAIGCIELTLVLSFVATRRFWSDDLPLTAAQATVAASETALGSRAYASVLMFFAYGGLEAGAGLWMASYLIETRGMSRALAGAAVAVYWGALCAGRFLIGARADAWGPSRVLAVSAWAAGGATIALAIPHTPTWFAELALASLGVSLSPIYPLTMHDTPHRFGPQHGARLVGYQVAATALGVASLPWLIGVLSATFSLTIVPSALCVLAVSVVGLETLRRSPTNKD